MAFTHYRTKAVFLKKEDRGEADQVFTLFTEDFGKVRVLGKAIRKIKSKLRAGTGLFCLSEIEFIQGKQYKTLTDAVLMDKFNVDYKVAEALDGLLAREQRDDKIWDLLAQTLQAASGRAGLPKSAGGRASDYFLWNLFDILGYAPQLYNCACCEKKLLPETFFFVPQDGGVVCWQCFSKKDLPDESWSEISVSAVKTLRFLLKEPFDIAEKLKIHKSEKEHLQDISDVYLACLKEAGNPR